MTLSKEEIIAVFQHLYKTEMTMTPEVYAFYVRLQKEVYQYLSIEEIEKLHPAKPENTE